MTVTVCLCHRQPLDWEARDLLVSLTEIGVYPLRRGGCVHGRLPAHEACSGCDHALAVYDAMLEAPTDPVRGRRWFTVMAELARRGGELTLAGPQAAPSSRALIRLVAIDEHLDIRLEPLSRHEIRLVVPKQAIDPGRMGNA